MTDRKTPVLNAFGRTPDVRNVVSSDAFAFLTSGSHDAVPACGAGRTQLRVPAVADAARGSVAVPICLYRTLRGEARR
jgi:hypothetical protein